MEKRSYIVSGLRPAISQKANQILQIVGMCDGVFVRFCEKVVITYKDTVTDTATTIKYIQDSYERAGGKNIAVVSCEG